MSYELYGYEMLGRSSGSQNSDIAWHVTIIIIHPDPLSYGIVTVTDPIKRRS